MANYYFHMQFNFHQSFAESSEKDKKKKIKAEEKQSQKILHAKCAHKHFVISLCACDCC